MASARRVLLSAAAIVTAVALLQPHTVAQESFEILHSFGGLPAVLHPAWIAPSGTGAFVGGRGYYWSRPFAPSIVRIDAGAVLSVIPGVTSAKRLVRAADGSYYGVTDPPYPPQSPLPDEA